MQDKREKHRLYISGGIFAVGLAQAPFLLLHAGNLWDRPHYEFFPFVLLSVAVLLWMRWPRESATEGEHRVTQRTRLTISLEWSLLVAGLVILSGGVICYSPWLSTVAGVLIAGCLLLRFAGRAALRELMPVWLLLWLIVPPPLRLDEDLVLTMQRATSIASSTVLDVLDVKHLLAGNVIELPGQQLLVAEACSGVHSQLVLIACAAIYVVVSRRTLLRGGLLIVSAFFWAAVVNIVRVSTVAITSARIGVDFSSGWPHEVLGYALVATGFLLVACTDQLLALLLARVPQSDPDAFYSDLDSDQYGNPLTAFWNRYCADLEPGAERSAGQTNLPSLAVNRVPLPKALVAGLACLGMLQLATLFTPHHERTIRLADAQSVFDETTLPEQLDQWERKEFRFEQRGKGSDEGHCSQIWQYASPQGTLHVSVDYPFLGWHELTRCYTARGWSVDSRQIHRDSSFPNSPFVEVELSKPTGEHALLMFGLFDGAGRPLTP